MVNGPKQFNCLSANIGNVSRKYLNKFKEKLDKYLHQIADQPRIYDLSPWTETNSPLHQTKRYPGGG